MIFFASKGRREREASERLYAACVGAARQPAFYRDLGVPDTFQGRFEMVTLHLFALFHRLMHDPGDDPKFAQLVSERFVGDMDGALRELGIGDLSVPKRMKALYASFAGRIAAYERALAESDRALAAAVARNVFSEATDGSGAVALATYLGKAVTAMRVVDLARLRAGEAPFPDVAPAADKGAGG